MTKQEWHTKYRTHVAEYYNWTCTECGSLTENKGCVHHKTYRHPIDGNRSVYSDEIKLLLSKDVVTWVCFDCHGLIHSKHSIDGITKIIPGKKCISCGKIFYGGDADWDHGINYTCWHCLNGIEFFGSDVLRDIEYFQEDENCSGEDECAISDPLDQWNQENPEYN